MEGPGWLNELGRWIQQLIQAYDQLLVHGRWSSPGTPASSITKTGRHDIAESGVNTKKSNQIKSLQRNVTFILNPDFQ